MHIYDGFLSTPVWAALDVAAAPAIGLTIRRAQRDFDPARIPLLGVMGAFVFAAQMINFPVGVGTSGHLVGGALLACTLGPAAAAVVMCAILIIQALVFQDGGLLALGPNLINMAIAGVLAGYLPFYLWGQTRWRNVAIFAGGALSVLVSAMLALAELLFSGVPMPTSVLFLSLGLFLVSAVLEGAITVTVIQALEAIQPGFVSRPAARVSFARGMIALVSVLLVSVGILFASTAPDGIESLGLATRTQHAASLIAGPLQGYELPLTNSAWLRRAGAGLTGLALIYGACVLIGRGVGRKK